MPSSIGATNCFRRTVSFSRTHVSGLYFALASSRLRPYSSIKLETHEGGREDGETVIGKREGGGRREEGGKEEGGKEEGEKEEGGKDEGGKEG